MSGDGISRNLSVELHIVQRQVYDCYTAVKRPRKYAWPVQRETGSPHWRSFEIKRKLSLMRWLPRNSCVVVVVNGSFDPGLCVVFGGVAKLEVSEGVDQSARPEVRMRGGSKLRQIRIYRRK